MAITSEEEKKNCCIDGPIIALLIIHTHSRKQHHSNHSAWLLIQLTAIAVKETACDSTPLSATWWWSYDQNMLWQ
jgi:hypothetical protein